MPLLLLLSTAQYKLYSCQARPKNIWELGGWVSRRRESFVQDLSCLLSLSLLPSLFLCSSLRCIQKHQFSSSPSLAAVHLKPFNCAPIFSLAFSSLSSGRRSYVRQLPTFFCPISGCNPEKKERRRRSSFLSSLSQECSVCISQIRSRDATFAGNRMLL